MESRANGNRSIAARAEQSASRRGPDAVGQASESRAFADRARAGEACFHCGAPCGRRPVRGGDEAKAFCCTGCLTVYELLTETGLGHFYDLGRQAGIRLNPVSTAGRYDYLDDESIHERLLDFSDGTTSRVTFHVPAVHCIACVWLLENLFRLHPAVGRSRVNFARKEVTVTYANSKAKLSEIAALLDSLGYAPSLNLAALDRPGVAPTSRAKWLQLGVAGFAFGNIMLFSLPAYLGLEAAAEPGFSRFFGLLSLCLALPVVFYSAADYWRSAGVGLRQRVLTIDLPICVGLTALFGQSAYEILAGVGEGYLDSLTGLVFFLLCGKVFQQKTYARLAFDRDYRSLFPLSVRRKTAGAEEIVPIARLEVGDRLRLRHGELIPADARLTEGDALIDYSFVTGESEPAPRAVGDRLYAGGRVAGGALEVEVRKPVSQSYLTSLWADDAFAKPRGDSLDDLTNRFSRWFTAAVGAIALGAAVYWGIHDSSRALLAFTSVLIVACPCALALAAPFASGTAQRLLARNRVFLRQGRVVEDLARVDSVVFDKTGTLTVPTGARVSYRGAALSRETETLVWRLASQSTHPLCRALTEVAPDRTGDAAEVTRFVERPGKGVVGRVAGHRICLGSPASLIDEGVRTVPPESPGGTTVLLAVDGVYQGYYRLDGELRSGVDDLLRELERGHDLTLLSGDSDREQERFRALFGDRRRTHFRHSPTDKLAFVRGLRNSGRRVLMVGDGLNDAGALQESDVGMALVEEVGAFSPASDVILHASALPGLGRLLRFAKQSVRVVRLSFLLSVLYNVVGVSFAARGLLSPLVCAILMPLSSITVVGFACGATTWAGRRAGWGDPGREAKAEAAARSGLTGVRMAA